VVLVIFMLVELAHQEQEQVLAEAEAVLVIQALAQMLLITMAVMVAQVVVVEAVPLLAVLLAQAVTALFFFTTKEF
jgi:hypothetical protein